MVREKKNIDAIKKSIIKFNDYSKKEKESLTESIEMFWLNAGIQKKNMTLNHFINKTNKLQGFDNC